MNVVFEPDANGFFVVRRSKDDAELGFIQFSPQHQIWRCLSAEGKMTHHLTFALAKEQLNQNGDAK